MALLGSECELLEIAFNHLLTLHRLVNLAWRNFPLLGQPDHGLSCKEIPHPVVHSGPPAFKPPGQSPSSSITRSIRDAGITGASGGTSNVGNRRERFPDCGLTG